MKQIISFISIMLAFLAAGCSLINHDPPQTLHAKFMLRGYCYAGSREDRAAPGGYGGSDNYPKKIVDARLAPDGKVSLIALPLERTKLTKKYDAMKLLLVNGNGKEVVFSASDSLLPILCEALDTDGHWKPIEYLPSSLCGNSCHNVFLPARHYWEFHPPVYSGPFKTRLRFALHDTKVTYSSIFDFSEVTKTTYSNEFDGLIDPRQFILEQGHQAQNVMDPYND